MAFLDPSTLLVFVGALALAYGVGRLVRTILRARRRPQSPPAPMTRAERRRAERRRR